MRRLLGLVLFSGCMAPVGAALDAEDIGRGGDFDLTLCGPGVSPPLTFLPARNTIGKVALGVCGNFTSDNTSTIDGEVRVRGSTRVASPVRISGSFFTGAAVESPNTLDVEGNFATAGSWTVSAPAHVGGDATVSGTLRHDNTVDIGGRLTAESVTGGGALNVGSMVLAASTVPMPLDCSGAPSAHSLATEIDAHPDSRATTTLHPDALRDIRQPTELSFGCAQYEVSELTSNNTLRLRITGPTVLVVHGRLHIASPTFIELEDDATLELIVDGALDIDNTLTIGDRDHPARVVVSGDIRVASPTRIYGVLMAPDSSIAGDNTLDVYGSMYVGAMRVAAPLVIHSGPKVGVEGWPTP
ncbi:MAG: hypothetical protein JNG84_01905 [Archangium sp.]|nr:hypothetical protein [Archangium sp.]